MQLFTSDKATELQVVFKARSPTARGTTVKVAVVRMGAGGAHGTHGHRAATAARSQPMIRLRPK